MVSDARNKKNKIKKNAYGLLTLHHSSIPS